MTTYTAAIGTASYVVPGDYCDVSVLENQIVGYRDEDGEEIPEYELGGAVMNAVETDVRVADENKLVKVEAAGDAILEAHGWARLENWYVADDALYALVERV